MNEHLGKAKTDRAEVEMTKFGFNTTSSIF
jgi:hypothetical protein